MSEQEELIEYRCRKLAFDILKASADDYKEAVNTICEALNKEEMCKNIPMPKEYDKWQREIDLSIAIIKDIVRFVDSDWFATLTIIKQDKFMRKLKIIAMETKAWELINKNVNWGGEKDENN